MLNSLDIAKSPADTRVVVAMSGGVDSSVVAALLAEQGYEVIGVTLQLYDQGEVAQRKGACCAGQDIYDARQVADRLGIAHYVLDYEERFRKDVIDRFAESYAIGETPVPCIECNARIKFRDLLDTAKDLGADVLATGHYVVTKEVAGGRGMFRPLDHDRDQSYFLFNTTPEQLSMLRFPLGTYTKPETRELARRYGLVVSEKPDSQDICFVASGHYSDVVAKLRPDALERGAIVHTDGRVLGEHNGILHYTIGQRKGLGVATGEPLYVVGLDADSRKVIVGPREALGTKRIPLRDLNWIGEGSFEDFAQDGREVFARVRSARAPRPAVLHWGEGGPSVDLIEGEEGVAPGQACVLYDSLAQDARVLGGGFIARSAASPTLAISG